MPTPLTHLGALSIEQFLADYWQQKPLLIRQAFPNFVSPLDADELAGLALEEEVESRIVLEQGPRGPWQLDHGPFTEKDFQSLPLNRWTLLVQAVDHWVPEVNQLLDYFRFLPNWRLDDIMVSYAANHGSVGPHYDFYDVFLLQGAGQRCWQLGQHCTADSLCLKDTDLNILAHFDKQKEWLLEPGDMLYIPPQLAHWGMAVGDDCMTYSIGFRAPSHADIVSEFSLAASQHLPAHQRFSDPGLIPSDNPGKIPTVAITQLQSVLRQYLDHPEHIADWFGRYMTSSKYDISDPVSDTTPTTNNSKALLHSQSLIYRSLSSRFAYHTKAETTWLFVDGKRLLCPKDLAECLCANTHFTQQILAPFLENPAALSVLMDLINTHKLFLDDSTENM